ncbi:MAG: hypothetical protein RLZZ450_5224 [Pseudomonadota bacterium]
MTGALRFSKLRPFASLYHGPESRGGDGAGPFRAPTSDFQRKWTTSLAVATHLRRCTAICRLGCGETARAERRRRLEQSSRAPSDSALLDPEKRTAASVSLTSVRRRPGNRCPLSFVDPRSLAAAERRAAEALTSERRIKGVRHYGAGGIRGRSRTADPVASTTTKLPPRPENSEYLSATSTTAEASRCAASF